MALLFVHRIGIVFTIGLFLINGPLPGKFIFYLHFCNLIIIGYQKIIHFIIDSILIYYFFFMKEKKNCFPFPSFLAQRNSNCKG